MSRVVIEQVRLECDGKSDACLGTYKFPPGKGKDESELGPGWKQVTIQVCRYTPGFGLVMCPKCFGALINVFPIDLALKLAEIASGGDARVPVVSRLLFHPDDCSCEMCIQ